MARVLLASYIVNLAGAFFLVPELSDLSCSPLKNHGTFSTIQVKVGIPPTSMDLVADTGSNDIIVQHCLCKITGLCPPEFGKCYDGTSKVGSVDLSMELMLSFGSGEIDAVLGSDYVQIGLERVYANKSLLFMVDQQLTISGQFEGILGLGRPDPVTNQDPDQVTISSFLEMANDPRFSMCFNYGSDGVLSMNTPKQDRTMGSVGQMHWGLDFRGISVGGEAQPVAFCSPDSKKPWMQTACGLIPDSGTTLIMGPQTQINKLLSDLCQKWELCRVTHADLLERTKVPGKKSDVFLTEEESKNAAETSQWNRTKEKLADGLRNFRAAVQSNSSEKRQNLDMHQLEIKEMSYTFQSVMQNCAAWMPEDGNIDSVLPSLFFHVAGSDGVTTDTLEMKPSSWVMEMRALVAHIQTAKILGVTEPVGLTITEETVCQAAFGASEYPTQLNGQVWIMGTPLFYEYKVYYDRAPNPPTIAIAREPCGSCIDSRPVASASLAQRSAGGMLRRIDEVSMPRFNTSLPL